MKEHIAKVVAIVEGGADKFVITFGDATTLIITMETIVLANGKHLRAAVVRYKNQIIWTSIDHLRE